MLKPEQIDEYSYNDVVRLYNDLTINVCQDMINKIESMGNITESSKEQIKILAELNGQEIFDEVLVKTSTLDDKTKKTLQDLYVDAMKKNMKDYKPLYEYRKKEFKLNNKQIKIINKAVNKNNKTIRNLSNSMAFQSKKTFIDSVNEAYNNTINGLMSYDEAIRESYEKIASTGLKIEDNAGRKVNVDVAIRRIVSTGIQQTANEINDEVGQILGCDGYEVTAHLGARPTHAIAQGKQYAVNRLDAKKYGVDWWYDKVDGTPVAELWEEYNCRHTVFPIILGISEPVYNKTELNNFQKKYVSLYGKRVPIYQATQTMRYIERQIREYKRRIKILRNKDHKKESLLLKKWLKEYDVVSKETGLEKDYARIRV